MNNLIGRNSREGGPPGRLALPTSCCAPPSPFGNQAPLGGGRSSSFPGVFFQQPLPVFNTGGGGVEYNPSKPALSQPPLLLCLRAQWLLLGAESSLSCLPVAEWPGPPGLVGRLLPPVLVRLRLWGGSFQYPLKSSCCGPVHIQ